MGVIFFQNRNTLSGLEGPDSPRGRVEMFTYRKYAELLTGREDDVTRLPQLTGVSHADFHCASRAS